MRVIQGVVEVGAAGASPAAQVDARPIPDLHVAAQRGPGEAGGRLLSTPRQLITLA